MASWCQAFDGAAYRCARHPVWGGIPWRSLSSTNGGFWSIRGRPCVVDSNSSGDLRLLGDRYPPHRWRTIRQLYAVWSQFNSIAVSRNSDISPDRYFRFGRGKYDEFLSRSRCHARRIYISDDRRERGMSSDPALCIVAPAGCDEL